MSAGASLAGTGHRSSDGSATPYTETGLTYHDRKVAPETVAPWVGSLAAVRDVGTLLHLTTLSQVVVLGADGGETTRICLRPATVVLPACDDARAWLVARPSEPVLEVGRGALARPSGLLAPDVVIRSGLVVGDGVALLVTLDGSLLRYEAGGLRSVALPPGTPRIWSTGGGLPADPPQRAVRLPR